VMRYSFAHRILHDDLDVEVAGEFADAGGEGGVHQVVGVRLGVEVGAIGSEGGSDAVAGKGLILDMGVVGGVARDNALEVSEFVENGGEEIVVSVCRGAGDSTEKCV
jgi:hypothetical protein